MKLIHLLWLVALASCLYDSSQVATAQTLTTLHQFAGVPEGTAPNSLVQGSDGYFYGTTGVGGTNNEGTVFRISSTGALTTLYQFSGLEGATPNGLVQGSDGDLYGTTILGGTNAEGIVFRISSAGTFTTLWQFCSIRDAYGNCLDGSRPRGLVQGSDGYFYGTTTYGGANRNCDLGCGTVFRISSAGTLTTLWQFCSIQDEHGNCLDGGNPVCLVQGSDGYFYGTTGGGAHGGGTVFRISSAGALTTLWQFCSSRDRQGHCLDGLNPMRLVQGSDGDFYGTTDGGGTNGFGMVFRISSAGTLTSLYSFGYADSGTVIPYPSLWLQRNDGYFYGTTYEGGTNSQGTVFRISSAGVLTTLVQFCGNHDQNGNCVGGFEPNGLVLGNDGYFYGTTEVGGVNCGAWGCGTVFKFDVPPVCSFSISPTDAVFAAAGGQRTVSVTALQVCAWSATSDVDWVSIADSGPGMGNGTVLYSIEANGKNLMRTGTLVIAKQTFTIIQGAYGLPRPMNVLTVVGNTPVVGTITPAMFSSGTTGNVSNCQWDFGDGGISDACDPSHVFSNCGPFTVTFTAAEGVVTNRTNIVITVPCAMSVTNFQAKLNFAKPNLDSCKFKAVPQPSQCTNWLGRVVTVDVGGAQVSWILSAKGKGVSTNGSCGFVYSKTTGLCTFKANLTHGAWANAWTYYGLTNTTIAKPGAAVTLPVILVIGDESFMAEKPLHYITKAGKSGIGK